MKYIFEMDKLTKKIIILYKLWELLEHTQKKYISNIDKNKIAFDINLYNKNKLEYLWKKIINFIINSLFNW